VVDGTGGKEREGVVLHPKQKSGEFRRHLVKDAGC